MCIMLNIGYIMLNILPVVETEALGRVMDCCIRSCLILHPQGGASEAFAMVFHQQLKDW